MKIAYLFSGDYRNFEQCFEFVRPSIHPEDDIYVSVWDESHVQHPNDTFWKFDVLDITREKIEKVVGRTINCSIDYVEPYVWNRINSLKFNSMMIYRWMAGFRCIKKSNIEYDLIVVLRPDFIVVPKSNLREKITNLDKNKFHFLGMNNETVHKAKRLDEQFFIVSPHNFNKMLNRIHGWLEAASHNWHNFFYWFIHGSLRLESNSVKDLFDDYIIARPSKDLSNKDYTIEQFTKNRADWNKLLRLEQFKHMTPLEFVSEWSQAEYDEIANSLIK